MMKETGCAWPRETTLPKEKLTGEVHRLMSDIKNALRNSPQFQQALITAFLDRPVLSLERVSDIPDYYGIPSISFEKDGDTYSIFRDTTNRNFVRLPREHVQMNKKSKDGTVICIILNLRDEILPKRESGEISFSQTPPGSKEEKIKNTREAVERIDEFIREFNSPTPATS